MISGSLLFLFFDFFIKKEIRDINNINMVSTINIGIVIIRALPNVVVLSIVFPNIPIPGDAFSDISSLEIKSA